MNPDTIFELIQEMKHKQRIFQEFMRFVDFNFDVSRYQFRASLINSYAHFLDALEAVMEDYAGEVSTSAKLIYDPERQEEKPIVSRGKFVPRQQSDYDPAGLLDPGRKGTFPKVD